MGMTGKREGNLPLSPAATRGCPRPAQLAALGLVLCMYRAGTGMLDGWHQAVAGHGCQHIDDEGIRESLCLTDRTGLCCWRLYLLPESDFLAWDRLQDAMPAEVPARREVPPLVQRLWQRLGRNMGGGWHVRLIRAHAVRGGTDLAVSEQPASAAAQRLIRRICQVEGVSVRCALRAAEQRRLPG